MSVDKVITVLLVDDEPDMRLMVRLHLDRDPRFQIVGEADNGEDAVEQCRQLQPDVVLLDMKMPTMDGMTALPLMRGACPDTAVLLFTAFADLVDPEAVREHDAEMVEKSAPIPWVADRLFERGRA